MSIPPFRIITSIPVTAVYGLNEELNDKVTSNPPITPGTNTKITYDEKGLVTSGEEASLGDLSNVEDVIENSNIATLRVLASPGFNTDFKYIDWTPPAGGGGGAYSASNVGTGTGVFNLLIGNNFTFNSLDAASNKVTLSLVSNTISFDVVPSNFTGIPQSGVTNLISDLASKLTANTPITPGTNTKITYDANGLVTAGTQASLADLSNVNTTPVSNSSGTLRVLASPGSNTSFQYVDWTPPLGSSYTASNVGTGTGVFDSLVSNDFRFNSIAANSSSVTVSLVSNTIRLDVVPSNFTGIPQSGVTNLVSDLASKLTANTPITPGTNTKITYDANGLVTAGTDASLADLSNVNTTPISNSSGTLRVLASPGADTSFQYVDWTPPSAVTSVFGRTGTVTAQSGDYNISQITNSSVLASTANVTITSPVNGQILRYNGTVWANFTPTFGTVTSVGLTMPSVFTVSGSPVTTSGTLAVTLNSQSANRVFAAPNGSAGTPTFRSLVAADLPTFTQNSILFAGVGGVISQSNASFNWNDTSKLLNVSNAATSIPSTGGVVTTLSGPLTILNGTNDSFRFISALDSSLAASGTRSIAFGRAASQYNQAELSFSYAGASSTSNALNIGLNTVNCIQVTPIQTTNNVATKFASTIVDGSNSAGTNGQVLTSTGTGVQWSNASTANTAFITFCSGGNIGSGQFFRPFSGLGGGAFNQNCLIMPRACTITAITGGLSIAPGNATAGWTFTLYKNSVATALTVSVLGVSTVANRATGSIVCSQFDLIAILITQVNGPATPVGYVTLEYI